MVCTPRLRITQSERKIPILIRYIVQLATPKGTTSIQSIAVCAGSGMSTFSPHLLKDEIYESQRGITLGTRERLADSSGGSVLKDVKADLLLTGEMSHVSNNFSWDSRNRAVELIYSSMRS